MTRGADFNSSAIRKSSHFVFSLFRIVDFVNGSFRQWDTLSHKDKEVVANGIV